MYLILTYLIGLVLVGSVTFVQQAVTLRLSGPRLGLISPSGLGVLVVMLGGSLLLVGLVGQRLQVARQRMVILYIMLAIGLPLGAMGGATALTGSIGRYVHTAGDATDEGAYARYPYYRNIPLNLWPGSYGSPEVMQFNDGGARHVPWEKWRRPLLMWNIFFGGTILCMIGLGIVLKRRWIYKESLPCPLNEIPGWFLSTDRVGGIGDGDRWTGWRSRTFWIGFLLVFLIFLNNGLAHYMPHLFAPLELHSDFGRLLTEEPLSAMKKVSGGPVSASLGGLLLRIIPALVAVAFFLPKEISFSILVFYFCGRLLTVVGSAVEVKWGIPRPGTSGFLGYLQGDTIPFLYSMGAGAFLFIAFGRTAHYLIASIRGRELTVRDLFPGMFLLIGGGAVVVWWLWWFGLPTYLALIIVAGNILLAVAFTRMRVEGGIPLLFGMPPLAVMLITMGVTPFTDSYAVAPGAADKTVSEISLEARAVFAQWHQANVSNRSNAFPVTERAVASSESPITARDFCAFLNAGVHDSYWSKDDHKGLVFRRSEGYIYVAGLCIFMLFTHIAVFAVPALLLEGFQLSDRVCLSGKHVVMAALLAIAVALAVGELASLPHFYDIGARSMATVPGNGNDLLFRTWGWSFVYDGLNTRNFALQRDPDWVRIIVAGVGFASAGILGGIRTVYCNFPLVPLGMVVAFLYGSWCWGSILIGYMAKTTILRFGGSSLYTKLKPFFVGLFCGHVAAMVLWAVVAYALGEFGNGFSSYIDTSLGAGAVF